MGFVILVVVVKVGGLKCDASVEEEGKREHVPAPLCKHDLGSDAVEDDGSLYQFGTLEIGYF